MRPRRGQFFGNEASAPAPKAKQIAADDYVEEEDEDRPVNAFASFGDYDECYPGYDVDMDDTGGFDKRGDKGNADGEGASERSGEEGTRFAKSVNSATSLAKSARSSRTSSAKKDGRCVQGRIQKV